MRIHNVTVEGFGPFKDRQVIDFSVFDADGLFLISGETGVGKTSILDAIAWALYNRTPRWDNVSATGASSAVRSDFCDVSDPTCVTVEFETNGREYRVTRTPEFLRPKKRGDGITKESASVLVEALEDGSWVGVTTKDGEAATFIEGLLKLNKDEFLQVIMLAQGRFQEFLLAKSSERIELLRKLFGTDRFSDYEERLKARRKAVKQKADEVRTKRAALIESIEAPEGTEPPVEGGEVEWIAHLIEGATEARREADQALASAKEREKESSAQLETARRQARFSEARRHLDTLLKKAEEIDAAKVKLEGAERAERVRPLLDSVAQRETSLAAMADEVAGARSSYRGTSSDDQLDAEVESLDKELGSLETALTEEAQLGTLADERDSKSVEVQQLGESLAVSKTRAAELQDERTRLLPVTAALESLNEQRGRLQSQLDAARAAGEKQAEFEKAQKAALKANETYTAARLEHEDLAKRFLGGQAAVLATSLVEGEPCMVCGSLEHPSPAMPTDDAVTEEQVEGARESRDRHEAKAKKAEKVEADLKVELVSLQSAAGESNVVELSSQAEAVDSKVIECTKAEKRIAEIDSALEGDKGLVVAIGQGQINLDALKSELTALETRYSETNNRLEAARGEFDSVVARQRALSQRRDGAKTLVSALRKHATALEQCDHARRASLEKALAESFESVDAAAAALLDESTMAGLREQIDQYRTAVAEQEGILKDPDLADLPDAIIEVAVATSDHQEANDVLLAAVREQATAAETVRSLESGSDRLNALDTDAKSIDKEYEVINKLTDTVSGHAPNTRNMSLESYYLAAELEDVLNAANSRLRVMCDGRFELRHTEQGVRKAGTAAGLELEVMDEFTGRSRPTHSLSGGQQFLASLALALGLAEVVTSRAGGIELNTLFVDEGFGSLSTDSLETAMATLDSLKQGGRTVAVISHVSSMQEQISAQLKVVAEPGGPSTVLAMPA